MHGRKLTVLRWSISAIIFTVSVVLAPVSRADYGEWTWISGSDKILQPGTYGTKGVPAEDNMPGARYGGASWTDSTGNFWFFGGYGLNNTDTKDYQNDLWRYEPDNDTWTWMGGSELAYQPGTYGTQGVPAANNVPGARYGSSFRADSTGNFWLFGGHGLDSVGTKDYLNDLWRYDPDNDTWTWLSGSNLAGQPGVYGIKGVPAEDNVPGARYESVSWTDSMGNFWLFGGYYGRKNNDRDYLNDLWRYDPDNDTWTWMSGYDVRDQTGTYGTKGVPAEKNMPGARYGSVAWMDGTGTMWLFGGYGYADDSFGYLNDLWRYDSDNDTWTWISGSKKASKSGTYGAQGMTAANNVPGGRYTGVALTDNNGNLWLFGGYGFAGSGRDGLLSDLWRYDPDSDMWSWISGSDKVDHLGSYGTQGVPAAANVPGSRDGSLAWMDNTGNLWLFGGYGYDYDTSQYTEYLNDLWHYQPPNDTNMRIEKCSIKAGTTDNIKFSGWMDAGEAGMNAALDGEIVISLWTDTVPDPDVTTFSFPLNEDTFTNRKYKSPKEKSADKSDPVLSFIYDSVKGAMQFSAANVDLTGLYCPITLTIQIGDYFVQTLLNEDIVNGPKKPCPLPLMMGVWDSLDVLKFKAKKSSKDDRDSFNVSGTFTVDGDFDFDTLLPVDIMLGPDTFSVPGGEFFEKKGVYSCKNVESGNGLVTAKFDTVKCAYLIKVRNTALNGSGDVDFSLDLFGFALQDPDPVALPSEF